MSIKDFFPSSLTAGQNKLIEELESFLQNENENIFLLQGYAGTGKTFITKGLTRYFESIKRQYILAAPTGKASKVISRKTGREAYTIHKTIYSDTDIKEYKVDNIDGTETYKFYFDLRVNENPATTVYIIDEASMIADIYQEAEFFRFGTGFLLKDLMEYINLDNNDHDKRVIFIGDNAQLPPVGMDFSPALDRNYLLEEFGLKSVSYELTEVVRQSGTSGILENSIKLRDSLREAAFDQLDIDVDFPDVHAISHENLLEGYLEACDRKIDDETIIIAHSNRSVKEYNDEIRELFFPGTSQLTLGDKVIVTANNNNYDIFISNGDFGRVKEVAGNPQKRVIPIKRKNEESGLVETFHIPLSFRDVEIAFTHLNGNSYIIPCKIVENLLYSDEASLSSDENKALYIDFRMRTPHLKPGTKEYKDTLRSDPYFNALKIKFGYAITCHKAQGSEWENVFVNCNTHQQILSQGYFRWLYTAITRSRSQLYTLDEPHIGYGSTMQPITTPSVETVFAQSGNNDPASPLENSTVSGNTNNFSFDLKDHFLKALYDRIINLVNKKEIAVRDIEHQQYAEMYHFEYKEHKATIKFHYNARSVITHLEHLKQDKFTEGLLRVLAPLNRARIVSIEKISFEFAEPFLEKQYLFLHSKVEAQGIIVSNISHFPWLEKYTFQRDGEYAIFDFYYNAKKQFTRYTSEASNSSSPEFVNTIQALIGGVK